MLKFFYILAIFLTVFSPVSAQSIKTKVLVMGGGATGAGTAIQAAHSGVSVVLVEETDKLGKDMQAIDTASAIGLEADFIKRYRAAQKLSGSKTDPAVAAPVLKDWTDTVKNLTVLLNASVQKVEKSGKGWSTTLTDGRRIKADILVDATKTGAVATKVSAEQKEGVFKTIVPVNALSPANVYTNNLYRTGTTTGTVHYDVRPIASFVSVNPENFLIANGGASLLTGQAAGATAAYCAFFKTSTKNLNIRIIQGELLGYQSSLVPFADIHAADSNFIAIQHLAVTGILKAKAQNNRLYFLPDSAVSFEEIRQPMKEYYSRSQIWFLDKKADKLTLNDALSLIKFSGSRGDELNREVEKAWANSFKFKNKFDLKKTITRREFAVLVDTYLKPFNVQVDNTGKLLQ